MQSAKCIAYDKRYPNLGDLLSIENCMATSVLAKKCSYTYVNIIVGSFFSIGSV